VLLFFFAFWNFIYYNFRRFVICKMLFICWTNLIDFFMRIFRTLIFHHMLFFFFIKYDFFELLFFLIDYLFKLNNFFLYHLCVRGRFLLTNHLLFLILFRRIIIIYSFKFWLIEESNNLINFIFNYEIFVLRLNYLLIWDIFNFGEFLNFFFIQRQILGNNLLLFNNFVRNVLFFLKQ
jgi:hypothetical protein